MLTKGYSRLEVRLLDFLGFHAGFWSATETTEIVGKRIVQNPGCPKIARDYMTADFVDFVGHMEVHRPLTGDPLQDGFSLTGVNVPRLSYRTILPATPGSSTTCRLLIVGEPLLASLQ